MNHDNTSMPEVRVSPNGLVASRFDTPAPERWQGIADGRITYFTDEDVQNWTSLVPQDRHTSLPADDRGSEYRITQNNNRWRVEWYDMVEGADLVGEVNTFKDALELIKADLHNLALHAERQRVMSHITRLWRW